MEYDLNVLKGLYDKFDIVKLKDGQLSIMDKRTQKIFSFEGLGAEKVKFAHYWVYATKFGHSTSNINGETTQSEYERAFSDDLKKVYDQIIANEIASIQASGHMLEAEPLKSEIASVPVSHASSVVDGLYSRPFGFNAFKVWCREVAKTYSVDEWLNQNKQL